MTYPMARIVRLQAMVAAEETPTTPAIKANTTKNPVAALPIGKYIGEKCAGRLNPVHVKNH